MEPSERNGILAGGLWLIDSTKHIDRYPEPSRLATVREVVRSNGGGAFNVLVDLAKLGAEFPLSGIGRIGEDAEGRWVEEVCRTHKVSTSELRRSGELPTSCTDVMTEAGSGRRTFFYLPGANALLGPRDFSFETSPGRIFYLGYPGLLPGLDAADSEGRTGVVATLERARKAGLATAIDLVSADSSDWQAIGNALPQVDLLFSNEWEAARLLQQDHLPEEKVSSRTLRDWGAALLSRGVGRAVVIHCSRGAVCVTRGASIQLGSVRVPSEEIRGTCGAGDALAAGFLLGYHRGASWADSLELAVCSAATCLHDLTSSGGVRPWKDCLAYGRRSGFQEF